MARAIRLQIEPVRTIGFAALGIAYSSLGAAMTRPIRMMFLANYTDTGVMISVDGVNDHIPMVPNGYMILDITSNKTLPEGFFLAEGQQLFVKTIGAPATTGSVYLTVFYGAEL